MLQAVRKGIRVESALKFYPLHPRRPEGGSLRTTSTDSLEPQQLDEDGSEDVRGCPNEGIPPLCVPVSHLCDMLTKST